MDGPDDPSIQFRALIDALPDAVAVHRHGQLLFVNPATLKLLGYDSRDELVGRPVLDILHPDDHDAVRARIDQMLQTGDALDMREERLVRRDGDEVVALVRALPVVWNGEPAALAFAQDVTELRRYEERLQVADRLASVGTLAAGMAHDLNNPLAHLFLALDLAEETMGTCDTLDASRTADVRRRVEAALHAAERLRATVEDLRLFARTPQDSSTPVSLAQPLRRALALAGNPLRHRCRVDLDIRETGLVKVSEARVVQAFLNVLTNAVQALPSERPARENRIRVSCGPTPEGLGRVEIEDNGQGIDEALLERVFEPYFTTKTADEGTGLGLWMVRGVVERIGGTIHVDSRIGCGTRITMDFPTVAPPPREVEPDRRLGRGLRILVVDDEPEVAALLGEVLGHAHEVEVVTTGAAAVARILEASPDWDVVLCDVMMPDLGGPEIYERVAAAGRGLEHRFVFATGGAFTKEARAFLERVDARVLTKPLHAQALRAVIHSEADRAASMPATAR